MAKASGIKPFLDHTPDWFVALFTAILTFVSTASLWINRLWLAGERQMDLIAANSAQQSRDMHASIKAAQDAAKSAQKSVEICRA